MTQIHADSDYQELFTINNQLILLLFNINIQSICYHLQQQNKMEEESPNYLQTQVRFQQLSFKDKVTASQPQQMNTSLETTHTAVEDLLNKFVMGKQLNSMLNGLSYIERDAKDLVKKFIDGVNTLEELEDREQRAAVQALFDLQTVKLIKEEKLLYSQISNKIKNASFSSKSRIYHKIANLLKYKKIEQKFSRFEISCTKSNGYKELSELELEQIVKYETIVNKTEKTWQNIMFTFNHIKRQSQSMAQLFVKSIQNNISTIKKLKYDLSNQQVMQISKISREACKYADAGIIILHQYLLLSCKSLQQNFKQTPNNIEVLLSKAIKDIYEKYPIEQRLTKPYQCLTDELPKFNHNIQLFYQKNSFKSTKKIQQIDQIIKKYCFYSQQCKESLQKLIQATCQSKCLNYNINLKYNPHKLNKEMLTQIKQQLFFNNDHDLKISGNTIKQALSEESAYFVNEINKIIEGLEVFEFKVKDMVRGKCVFKSLVDVISAVNSITNFAAKNNRHLDIKSIQNRYTQVPYPTSDITMTLFIAGFRVSLQLTTQGNNYAYTFHNYIHELSTCKTSSKLKKTHNDFISLKDDFRQLAENTLELLSNKSTIPLQIIKNISQYFDLQPKSKAKSFKSLLIEEIHQNKKKMKKLSISIDPSIEKLIQTVINIGLGKWDNGIGKIINKALKQQQISPKLKSVILSAFFHKLNLAAQSYKMMRIDFFDKPFFQENFMQTFIRNVFQIQNAFDYCLQNQRLYYRTQQLRSIVRKESDSQVYFERIVFSYNLVIEQVSLQILKQHQQIINFQFATKGYFSHDYSEWVQWITKILQFKGYRNNLKGQIQFLTVQQLINSKNPQQALRTILCRDQDRMEKYEKMIYYQILQIECKIKTNQEITLEESDLLYKDLIQKAKIFDLQLSGALYADSLWRVQNFLYSQQFQQDKKIKILKTFTARALQQMSINKGERFIQVKTKRWPLYESNKIQKPKIGEDIHMKYLRLTNIQAKECEYISQTNWKDLTFLTILGSQHNYIGALGCEYLSKTDWKNITTINLNYNKIGDKGCQYLAEGQWKNISRLYLDRNEIGSSGCLHISEAGWKDITTLHLHGNKIGDSGTMFLVKADWKNITTLDLSNNCIGAMGCHHISQANWKNIIAFDFSINFAEELGSQYLSQCDWKNIVKLNLESNNIKLSGWKHLSKANWKSLKQLNLKNHSETFVDYITLEKLFTKKDIIFC